MKLFLTLSALLVVVLALPGELLQKQWGNFKTTHNKRYKSLEEEFKRLGIFEENLKKIQQHNQLYREGTTSYKMGVNHFADWSRDEFLSYANSGKSLLSRSSTTTREGILSSASFDWRDQGAVTPVKDQGICSAGWAFAALESLEGLLYLKTENLTELSAQNLVDCAKASAACAGGYIDGAFWYITEQGLELEADYPYKGYNEDCAFDADKSVVQISGMNDNGTASFPNLANVLANVGPIATGFIATENLQFYESGLFTDDTCRGSYFELDSHYLLIVGYGSENGTNFWIVKNSWGTDWGEEGYARIVQDTCLIGQMASYPIL